MKLRDFVICVPLAAYPLLAPPPAAPQDLPPGVLMVSRLKARIKEQIAHMPQYTCLETFERSHKLAGPKTKLEPQDTVRLEVLFTGAKEFFDSPGGRDFREENPGAFISSGVIGNGMFAGHLQTLFVNDQGIFTYRGEEPLDGRPAVKWDFRVPLMQSRYTINMHSASAEVGEKGAFWADPVTLDLIRLEVHADEIPPQLELNDAITTMQYARTRIGQDDVLLPQTGELRILSVSGEESLARFEFTHCRSFQSATSISFAEPDAAPAPDPAAAAPAANRAAPPAALPAGLKVSIALTSAVTNRDAVGGLIEARVTGNVTFQGKIVIPDGAAVHGRIRRMDHSAAMGGYFTLGFEFTDIEAGGVSTRFFAALESAAPLPGLAWNMSSTDPRTVSIHGQRITETEETVRVPALPGVGTFFLRGPHLEIPKGWKMVWKTQAF